jgi:hypothetical protein
MIEPGANGGTDTMPINTIEDIAESEQPIAFGLFDTRLCEVLDFSWLVENSAKYGITEQELKDLLDRGLLKAFPTQRGKEGFLLYTPEQVKAIREWKGTCRYGDGELQHILEMWNSNIECTVEVLPYDDPEIPDFDHLRRRLAEYIGETKRQIAYVEGGSSSPGQDRSQDLARFNSELSKAEGAASKLDSWNPSALTEQMRKYIQRSLFHLRFLDEWVRMENAQAFQAQVNKGYSPEVMFRAWTHGSAGFTFERIDWSMTLRTLRESRSTGQIFPLRTPEFDLVERGLILRGVLTLETYAKLNEQYELGKLRELMAQMGSDIWKPFRSSTANTTCPECGAPIRRSLPTKRYCSERCRSRAKQRRYRERDPERARLSQVRYWTSYVEPTD